MKAFRSKVAQAAGKLKEGIGIERSGYEEDEQTKQKGPNARRLEKENGQHHSFIRRRERSKTEEQKSAEEYSKLEAEAKEAMIASKLAEGYFTEDFDAVAQSLQELPSNPNPRYLEDRVAEKLLTLQMLNERLYAHIMDNYGDFVSGIEAVTEVESDLQVAHILARNSRRSLALCSEEVKSNARIAANARRKQQLLHMLDLSLQLQEIIESVGGLQKGLEEGHYAWTVKNTLQCCEVVSQLDPEMLCMHELRISVMRILDDALAYTDETLQSICSNFDSEMCSRVFDVYLALGDATGLSDKLQACFAQAALGTSHSILKSYTCMKPASKNGSAEQQINAFQNKPYNELCKSLSIDQFRPTLLKTFEILLGVMVSQYEMIKWHKKKLGELEEKGQSNDRASNAAEDTELNPDNFTESCALAKTIIESLMQGRKLLWEHIEGRVGSLLSAPAAGEGEHFLQTLEWTQCFISCGDSFCESKIVTLRNHASRQSSKFFDAFHRQNMEALRAILEKELWHNLPIDSDAIPSLIESMSIDSGALTLRNGQATLPFKVLVEQKNKLFKEGTDPVAQFRMISGSEVDIDGGAQTHDKPVMRHNDQATFTSSSLKVLKCMEKYSYLMKLIGKSSTKVVEGFCQLFDLYFWYIFQLFGNKEMLASKSIADDNNNSIITPRLRKTLERISLSTSYVMGQYLDGEDGQASPRKRALPMLSSGNLYGLREMTVAISSLSHISNEILSSKSCLQSLAPDVLSDHLETFFNRTIMAVDDLKEHIYHRIAGLLLSLGWVPEQIEKCKWDIKDVGMQHSEWVDKIVGQFHQFHLKLGAIGVKGSAIDEFWQYAVSSANESILEGFSRVKKCTIEGRAAMSLDLQMFSAGVKKFAPKDFAPDVRLVDGYIKAFYVPESDLLHWAMTHREYKKEQIASLVTCIFDANKPSALNPLEVNKRKKALKDLLGEIAVNMI